MTLTLLSLLARALCFPTAIARVRKYKGVFNLFHYYFTVNIILKVCIVIIIVVVVVVFIIIIVINVIIINENILNNY